MHATLRAGLPSAGHGSDGSSSTRAESTSNYAGRNRISSSAGTRAADHSMSYRSKLSNQQTALETTSSKQIPSPLPRLMDPLPRRARSRHGEGKPSLVNGESMFFNQLMGTSHVQVERSRSRRQQQPGHVVQPSAALVHAPAVPSASLLLRTPTIEAALEEQVHAAIASAKDFAVPSSSRVENDLTQDNRNQHAVSSTAGLQRRKKLSTTTALISQEHLSHDESGGSGGGGGGGGGSDLGNCKVRVRVWMTSSAATATQRELAGGLEGVAGSSDWRPDS